MPTHAKTTSCIALLVGLALTLVAAPARADESEAERLFREGRALMLDGRFDQACPMLEQSQRLDPHVGTLLNVAACHERQGRVGSAWVEYQKALTAARAEGQAERVHLAETRIAALEPRVPWLRISSALEDVAISLDGGELARAAWGQEMPVDPGVHDVVAERRGVKVFEASVSLRESERRTVRVVSDPGVETLPSPTPVTPERVVIEPQPRRELGARPSIKGRWIFEPGLFVGYLGGEASHPRLDPSQGLTLVSRVAGQPDKNCSSDCTVAPLGSGGGVVGLNVYAGYALSDAIDLGLRVTVAPALGGAGAWGFGPAITLHPTEAIGVGLWGAFGDATFEGQANVTGPAGYTVTPSRASAEGVLAGGFGAGVALSLRLFELVSGSFHVTTTPFFFGGNGNAFCLPLGVAYRLQ